ncbi:hypothetical protein A2303_02305 [Candidatus Falkowbacteria bacterium RIFOXYB2_FULL_47_14]|uniref:EF-hand domain-containing protein n=1 Tax=Candidatus Falkowbacteria bacterium RIFOXYA2_FULL_47_19 TaxID=1797994 RepID=A0A1F5SF01_9BACT|nr:MAG: hypothetical protein A2227_07480 [Candidatus Falkowbacteria bacterium RIFOXYA2_FULL_47_19]OGF35253.1 MAG: hypothetical protein A2468_01115 [Candidatus Falkowbacteria bacterium RIFOXYC2_FULL_46_15]OGF43895.1 MAG: hypothetical protein A2303_02305 [Candidatus Falkowbacteria bacterium RIFOXYB2_FULL_47_14]
MLNNEQGFESKQENREPEYAPIQPGLNKNQKISLVVLGFFTIFIIFLWSAQFKNNLSGINNSGAINSVIPLDTNSEQDDLYSKDTDGDGLSDGDELYLYKTSPYLEDSDSDGFLDKNEIDSEHDPNCPEDRECYGTEASADADEAGKTPAPADSMADILEQLNRANTAIPAAESSGGETPDAAKVFGGEMSAADLRTLLISSGADEAMIGQFSDEEIVNIYKEILAE